MSFRPRLNSAVFSLSLLLLAGCAPSADEVPVATSIQSPTWHVQYEDSTALFIGMYAVDANTVWVSGNGGRVGRTIDGGTTWEVKPVPGAESLQFRDVHGLSADVAYALSIGNGTDSRIYKTVDGGATWDISFQNTDENNFFDCMSFWDDARGFAFSDSYEGEFTLMRTMDGGATWARIDPAAVPDARPGEGAFASSGTCVVTRPGGLGWFVTGASGVDTRVMRTTDYGDTWSEVVTPMESGASTAGIFSLSMLNDTHGAIFGGDFGQPDSVFANVAVTRDGGASWTMAGSSNLGGSVFGGAAIPGAATESYVAVAPTGSDLSVDGGQTWNRIDSVSYWTVAFHSPDAGWAAGPGRISRFMNGHE